MPMRDVEMPSAAAKSGPSGITITKSSTLTNWIAPIRKMISRSDTTGGWTPTGAASTTKGFSEASKGLLLVPAAGRGQGEGRRTHQLPLQAPLAQVGALQLPPLQSNVQVEPASQVALGQTEPPLVHEK